MDLKEYVDTHLSCDCADTLCKASNSDNWSICSKKLYSVKIMRADENRIYNTEKRGVVYNFLEDVYEPAKNGKYIVEGTCGELWVIGEDSLKKYDISPTKLSFDPVVVNTVPSAQEYCFIRIPASEEFSLSLGDYSLKGNRKGIEHGLGDCIVTAAVLADGCGKLPVDINDMWIVNGKVFDETYKILQTEN